MAHPSFGPLSPEEIARLVDAPVGVAGREIRKHDPIWGMKMKAPKKFKASLERVTTHVERCLHGNHG